MSRESTYWTRRQTMVDEVRGLIILSSSPEMVKGRFCVSPIQFGNVEHAGSRVGDGRHVRVWPFSEIQEPRALVRNCGQRGHPGDTRFRRAEPKNDTYFCSD